MPEWRAPQQEELQHLEMTAGFSESLRPLMPRRSVRIKRPGKTGAKGTLRTAMKGLSINELKPPARVSTSGARDGMLSNCTASIRLALAPCVGHEAKTFTPSLLQGPCSRVCLESLLVLRGVSCLCRASPGTEAVRQLALFRLAPPVGAGVPGQPDEHGAKDALTPGRGGRAGSCPGRHRPVRRAGCVVFLLAGTAR